MADTIQDALNTAKSSGYSNDEIVQYLSDHPVYGSRVKTALTEGHGTDEIVDFLSGLSSPNKIVAPPQATTPLEIAKGVGSGAASTVTGLRDLGSTLYKKATKMETPQGTQQPFGDIPQVPATLREFAKTPENASPGFKLAKAGEQLAEFVLPGMAASKAGVGLASTAAKIFGAGSKTAELAEAGAKLLGETAGSALGTGVLSSAQAGGDPETLASAAILGGVTTGAFRTIGGLLKSVSPNWAYKGLKLPKDVSIEDAHEIFRRALDRGVVVSKTGAEKAADFTTAASARTAATLAQPGISAQPIDFNNIETAVQKLLSKSTRPPGTVAPLVPKFDKQIMDAWEDFQTAYGAKPATPSQTVTSAIAGPNGQPIQITIPGRPAIPPQLKAVDGQAAKKALQDILDSAYGKYADNPDEALKAIAYGLRKDLERIAPAIKESNRDAQQSLLLTDALEKFVKSHGYTSHPYILTGSLIAALGLPGHYGMYTLPPAIILEALSNPRIRSALAIAATRGGKAMQVAAPYTGGAAGAVSSPSFEEVTGTIPQMPVGIK